MHILLCAATELEIKPVTERVTGSRLSNIEILITGVGLTAATYSITRSVSLKRPSFIIQAGVAGCLDKKLPLTKIVIVENEMIGDLGVMEDGDFRSVSDLGLQDKNSHPWANGRLKNSVDVLKQTGLPIVDGVTVNEITTSAQRIDHYRDVLGASVETMEGAALHYVALMEKFPFLQIRSLSNFIGERDKSKWVLDMAIATLNLELERIVQKLR